MGHSFHRKFLNGRRVNTSERTRYHFLFPLYITSHGGASIQVNPPSLSQQEDWTCAFGSSSVVTWRGISISLSEQIYDLCTKYTQQLSTSEGKWQSYPPKTLPFRICTVQSLMANSSRAVAFRESQATGFSSALRCPKIKTTWKCQVVLPVAGCFFESLHFPFNWGSENQWLMMI